MRTDHPEDPAREERIHNEVVVDCHDEYERQLGWWNYLSDELNVPFRARSTIDSVQTVLKKGEEVQVVGLFDPGGEDLEPIRILAEWQDRTFAAPLSELEPIDADEATTEAVADWCYWVARGHLF